MNTGDLKGGMKDVYNGDIFVHKNFFEPNQLDKWTYELIHSDKWAPMGTSFKDGEKTGERPHFILNSKDLLLHAHIVSYTHWLIKDALNVDSFEYFENQGNIINAIQVGDTSIIHRDGPTKDAWTMIVYLNKEWNPDWGGKTEFYNKDLDEVVYSHHPNPGSVILFRQSIPHGIAPVSTLSKEPRYSFVVKGIARA